MEASTNSDGNGSIIPLAAIVFRRIELFEHKTCTAVEQLSQPGHFTVYRNHDDTSRLTRSAMATILLRNVEATQLRNTMRNRLNRLRSEACFVCTSFYPRFSEILEMWRRARDKCNWENHRFSDNHRDKLRNSERNKVQNKPQFYVWNALVALVQMKNIINQIVYFLHK